MWKYLQVISENKGQSPHVALVLSADLLDASCQTFGPEAALVSQLSAFANHGDGIPADVYHRQGQSSDSQIHPLLDLVALKDTDLCKSRTFRFCST